MSDANLQDPSEDELLSAYVDGELSDDERAAVEQRLQDDPQARELVADLRAVSQSLQALPKLEIGADLREAVLRRSADHVERPPVTEGGSRRWVWASAALAAALLLTFYVPEANHEEQPLAQAPRRQMAPRAEPREKLEFGLVAEIPSERLPGVSGDTAEIGMRAEGSVAADHFALSEAIGGAMRAAPIESPQLQPIGELPTEDYHIHLAAVDQRVGLPQFDELLHSHGIVVEDDQDESLGSDSDEGLEQGERVLVEASLEQIQQLVASCGGENSSWQTLRLIGQDSASTNLLLGEPETAEGESSSMRSFAALSSSAAGQKADAEQPSPTKLRVLFILHPAID